MGERETKGVVRLRGGANSGTPEENPGVSFCCERDDYV